MNEETKRDLGGIDDQIQKHALQESQLTSFKSQIQSIIASSNDLRKRRHPQSQLIHDKVQDVTKLLEVCSYITILQIDVEENCRSKNDVIFYLSTIVSNSFVCLSMFHVAVANRRKAKSNDLC